MKRKTILSVLCTCCLVLILAGVGIYKERCRIQHTYGYYKQTMGLGISENTVVSSAAVAPDDTPKKAFLTFDDGPSELTEQVLDILDEQDIHATFFLIGEQITKEREAVVRRMYEEGHEVGIHTYTHEPDEIYASAQAYVEDVLKTAKRIEEVTGKRPQYYRFPWGSANCYISSYRQDVIEELAGYGFQYVDWNVSGEDSVGNPSAWNIYARIKKDYNRYNEPVVLMHDSQSNKMTVQALPDIEALFSEGGYEFGTIKERSKPYQWNVKS